MKISEAGIAFIKSHEGVRLKAYKDSVGVWTIGVGSTADVHEGLEIDDAEVDRRLRIDLSIAEQCIEEHVPATLTQNQFDALVSLVFNIGCRAFSGSTLISLLNAGNLDAVPAQFLRWDKGGGKQIAGLTRRRKDESELFQA